MDMPTRDEMELLIWRCIDGDCNEAEQQYVLQQIATNTEWKGCYDSLLELNNTITANIESTKPAGHFSENVMDKIMAVNTTPVYKQYINKWVVKGIAAFFIISLGAVLAYSILHTDFGKSSYSFDYSRFLNTKFINAFIFVNIIVALMFADSLLRRKMRNY